MSSLFVNNDHTIKLEGLRDAAGTVVAGAVVEATLFMSDGVTVVDGATWPITLGYTGKRGTYSGELPGMELEAGKRYVLRVTALFVGKRYEEELVLRASRRRGTETFEI